MDWAESDQNTGKFTDFDFAHIMTIDIQPLW